MNDSTSRSAARLWGLLLLLLCVTATTAAAASAAAPQEPREPSFPTVTSAAGHEMVAGQVVVRFEAGTTAEQRSSVLSSVPSDSSEPIEAVSRARVIDLADGTGIGQAVSELEARAAVDYAEPNYVMSIAAVPDDPMYPYLWGLEDGNAPDHGISAQSAWNQTTGSPDVRVAVVDSGISVKETWTDKPHPDLDDNVNQALSRNFTAKPWEPVDAPPVPEDWYDSNDHGTHVAGTIGAEGNNGLGVTGVNWDTEMVAVRVLDFSGSGASTWVAAGLDYAGDIGSDVANVSLGGTVPSQLSQDAIASHPNTLYVIAAGNGGSDDIGDDIDVNPTYPCRYDQPNTLCVAAIDTNGNRPAWSNFGDQSVHLGAPGVDVLSTIPSWTTPEYDVFSGTSMATPHVAGTAALVKSVDEYATVAEVKQAILENTVPTPSLAGKTVTGGRLNAADALQSLTPKSECRLPDGTTYRTFWREQGGAIDVTDIRKRGAGATGFVDFADFWGDVAKMEWWTPNTMAEMFTQAGAWGNPSATTVTNAWDYAYWYGAVDQRSAILNNDVVNYLGPRVSFRTNGSGLVRDADVCDIYLSRWTPWSPTAGKRTAIVGDSMTVQMAKKFNNTSGWRLKLDPQAGSSFATMKGEIRGMAAGMIDPSVSNEQTPPQVLVMALGTKDADHIAAGATQADRDNRLTGFGWNLAGMLMETAQVQCRILVTTHVTGWKADGTYSSAQLAARQAVNTRLRDAAAGSSSIDIVDWAQMSAGHEAHQPAGTRWYEPTDRDNPNAAGLTALSNAIIDEAKGSCS